MGAFDLVNKLNVDEINGTTYLDNSLVVWTKSRVSHPQGTSIPVITAGGASGFFNTGLCDYRNRNNLSLIDRTTSMSNCNNARLNL